ncbi:MAG: metallopeptidase TldD-related protein, partial [Rhodobacteraceae bacterium]|nr:metallopeptidase TldD-related protein [Paracoccaceae bacterium]
SWLKDDLGNEILPTNLDLYEEPFRPKSLSSTLYDGEGIAKQERKFIEKGTLKSWVMDLATSRKLEMPTTGNATRGVSSPPSPGTTNIALTCGNKSPGEMMKEIDSGILITSLIGSTINSNTGDYSRGASGFLIENGEVTQPISEFTIAGNLRNMIKTLIPSNDPREFSSYKVPSLLIENMTVAGS